MGLIAAAAGEVAEGAEVGEGVAEFGLVVIGVVVMVCGGYGSK